LFNAIKGKKSLAQLPAGTNGSKASSSDGLQQVEREQKETTVTEVARMACKMSVVESEAGSDVLDNIGSMTIGNDEFTGLKVTIRDLDDFKYIKSLNDLHFI